MAGFDAHSANSFSFETEANVQGDVDDSLDRKDRLTTNLSKALDSVMNLLEKLDSEIASADGDVLGEKLLNVLETAGESLKVAADYVLASDDNCESVVDSLLAIESGAPIDDEYEYVKGTLMGIINTSPGILMDVSSALKSLTLEEAVEISEVGLELSCVGVVLSRFVLEKVDVEGIIDEVYDGRGGVDLGAVRQGGKGKEVEDSGIEFLDEEEEEKQREQGSTTSANSSRRSFNKRKLKKLPLVFWPRVSKILLSPFTHSNHPIRHYIAANPKLSFLLSICLLTPPPILIGIFFLPPILITDEIVHKVYGSLVSAYPDTFEGIEITMKQMVELLKLYVLLGKLFFKTLSRILQRQIKRRGGIRGVAKILAGKVAHGAMHPIETTGVVLGVVKDVYGLVRDLGGGIYESLGPVDDRVNGINGGHVALERSYR